MDRKSILVLAICVVLFLAWSQLVTRIYPPIPVKPATNQLAGVTNPATAGTNFAERPVITNTASMGPAPKFIVLTNVPEQLVVVSNASSVCTFTSRGGGLQEVELPGYPETVSTLRRKSHPTNVFASLNDPSVAPVLAILGDESVQGDGIYQLTPITNGVRAEKTLSNGLSILKEFQLGSNYLLSASVRFKNNSGAPLKLRAQDWVIGTATPMGPHDAGQAVSVLAYDGMTTEAPGLLGYFNTNRTTMFVFSRTPKMDYKSASSHIVWASVQNQFFALATMPEQPAGGMSVGLVDLPPPTAEEIAANPGAVRNPHGLETTLAYPALTLTAGEEVTNRFNIYAGPKEYRALAGLGERFHNRLELLMQFGYFGWFARVLLAGMSWLHHTLYLPYGWAIVVITVLIKLIFWPLTQYSTKSMKRMQALGPQMKAMQEKYKDDPQKLQAKTWEFYKKNKVNPLSGCFPMLLQLPVLYGFFTMLRSAIELRGAPFLWIGDLSQPDTVFILPGFNFPVNPMPLLMGATMLWQSHLTPPSPGMDPAQQKIMRYLPLMFLVFLYNFSSGLALYWTVQNLLSIVQTKLINAQTSPAATPTQAPAPAAPQKRTK